MSVWLLSASERDTALAMLTAKHKNKIKENKDEPFKRFQSQGLGHRNEHEYTMPCMSTVMCSLNDIALILSDKLKISQV